MAPMEADVVLYLSIYLSIYRGSQGGGLIVSGTATLTNTNVYSNQALGVCSPSALT